jgi:hypothetical protein
VIYGAIGINDKNTATKISNEQCYFRLYSVYGHNNDPQPLILIVLW